MRWPGMTARHVPRVATLTFPSPTAHVSSWRWSVSTCPRRRQRGDRVRRRDVIIGRGGYLPRLRAQGTDARQGARGFGNGEKLAKTTDGDERWRLVQDRLTADQVCSWLQKQTR